MVQTGIIISAEPKIKEGDDIYIISNPKIPNLQKLNKTGFTRASVELIRTTHLDDCDDTVRLEWIIAKDGEMQSGAGIFKRMLSIAPLTDANSATGFMSPADVMKSDMFPDPEDIDGLVVMATLSYGKEWTRNDGTTSRPVNCWHMRAPTTDEGYAHALRTQNYATAIDIKGWPAGFEVYDAPVREREEGEE
jgi:hypothetical protein